MKKRVTKKYRNV